MDLILGSAHPGDRLRRHLLDHGHRELPQPQRQRRGGGCFHDGGGGGRQLLVADPWPDWGPRRCLCCSPVVVSPNDLRQVGEEEKDKTWIAANSGAEQDCSLT